MGGCDGNTARGGSEAQLAQVQEVNERQALYYLYAWREVKYVLEFAQAARRVCPQGVRPPRLGRPGRVPSRRV